MVLTLWFPPFYVIPGDTKMGGLKDGSVADNGWQLAVSQVDDHIGNQLQRRIALRAIVDNMPDYLALKNELEARIN